ncbi:MAG: hypothetical protein NVS3B7_03470 [Candidatus Elarobacter sp.]
MHNTSPSRGREPDAGTTLRMTSLLERPWTVLASAMPDDDDEADLDDDDEDDEDEEDDEEDG